MALVFDQWAGGRCVKPLTVVDDCSKETVQIIANRSITAQYVTRVLEQIKARRGLPDRQRQRANIHIGYDAPFKIVDTKNWRLCMTVRTLPCLIAVFTLVGALATVPVQAASSNANTPASAKKTVRKPASHSVKFHNNPNHENAAQRERRLKRECKGLPNAGACLGYAS
jgi:hypothetical protein